MKKLIEKKNDLITRAEEILELAKTEDRDLTDEERAELIQCRDEAKKIAETLALEEEIRGLDEMEHRAEEEETEVANERDVSVEQMEREAFENFVRGFVVHERSGELTPASGVGGALIPTTIANMIIKKVYDICPILERSQKFNIKGNLDIPYYPYDSDNITVAYANEFSALTSSTGEFASVTLGGFLAGALTKISRSLINNTEFDIVTFMVDEMAEAIKRFIEKEMLVGTTSPSAKVLGLSTLDNKVTADATTAVTADEIIELHDKVKDQYQNNAIWIMSSATRTALRQLKDNTGRYLLQDDISLPFGTSILGKPVFVSDNMPDMAASARAIFYGDMTGIATKFSEEMNIEVLREKYADEHAVGVIGWLEFDAKVVNEQKMAVLVMAAS